MPLVSIDNISKVYRDRNVLDGVSFRINSGDKIAFIGNNGAGKTTLFKIIKGMIKADEGKVMIHGNSIVGFLSQNMDEQDLSGSTLKPQKLIELEEHKTALEYELSSAKEGTSQQERLLKEYSSVLAQYEGMGGYDYEYRINDALAGLGLVGISDRPDFTTLSGGEKMRVCLAQLVVARPDVLLLDEPTNHLDIEAVEWLEDYLSSYGGAVFVISHDRHFIDKVANRVIELIDGTITEYKGNYSDYIEQKEMFIKTQKSLVDNLQDELNHQLDVKQTMLSHRNISGYHQREKMVDKLSDILQNEKAKLSGGEMQMNFKFVPEERSGASDKILISVKDVSKKFDDDPMLFEHISFELKADEKLFLCGPNGCGKSTLLTMLLGKQGGFDGTVLVSAGAKSGFMGQFVPFADESITCLEELMNNVDLIETQARSILARFGFRELDVHKRIDVLSGGERTRLYLCRLLLEKPDILFLDEPTNHLDISSREVLEDALSAYDGAIVCVSHDRFFIDKCAHKILGFMGKTAMLFDKYSYYRKYMAENKTSEVVTDKIEEEKTSRLTQGKVASINKASERKAVAARRERIRSLEQTISELEESKETLEASFVNGASTEEYHEYTSITEKLEHATEEYLLLCDEEEKYRS